MCWALDQQGELIKCAGSDSTGSWPRCPSYHTRVSNPDRHNCLSGAETAGHDPGSPGLPSPFILRSIGIELINGDRGREQCLSGQRLALGVRWVQKQVARRSELPAIATSRRTLPDHSGGRRSRGGAAPDPAIRGRVKTQLVPANVGVDKGHPGSVAGKARDALGAETIDASADRGYFKSEDIAACEEAGIEAYVPRPRTSNARAEGRYDRRDFVYDAKSDTYVCPAGERLTHRMTAEDAGKVLRRYWTDACGTCALKAHCTPSKQRRVARWENEAVLDRVQARLDQRSDAMIVRRSTVEHPFGTIRAWMGATHFKMKTLRNVATEMALHVLAYNIKRVIAILGVPTLSRPCGPSRPSRGTGAAHRQVQRPRDADICEVSAKPAAMAPINLGARPS
jgi:Transposase DDE domain